MFDLFKDRRRDKLRQTPFPANWDEIARRNLPIYRFLDDNDRRELQGLIQVFLAEKNLEGCGGLVLTDEIRVTIAAQACILLLHRNDEFFDRLVTVLVYPNSYTATGVDHLGGGMVIEGEQARLGEASLAGVVVLSWEDARRGAFDPRDGHNVVLHEFAHQLDLSDGAADGTPVLESRSRYTPWARVMGEEFDRLRQDDQKGRKTVLDKYGATNAAEFFAVATECFFEKPMKLKKKHPELYEELRAYYQFDPEPLLAVGPKAADRSSVGAADDGR